MLRSLDPWCLNDASTSTLALHPGPPPWPSTSALHIDPKPLVNTCNSDQLSTTSQNSHSQSSGGGSNELSRFGVSFQTTSNTMSVCLKQAVRLRKDAEPRVT